MKRYFWRVMENQYLVWGARVIAGYMFLVVLIVQASS
jgi:hypothetical protein